MDEVVAELAERAITGGLPDIHEPSIVGALRRYVEQLVGDDWTSAEFAKQQAWAVENSDPYLQITLGHKPIHGNHLVALLCASRLWEVDPALDCRRTAGFDIDGLNGRPSLSVGVALS
jgi:hypothetical protein